MRLYLSQAPLGKTPPSLASLQAQITALQAQVASISAHLGLSGSGTGTVTVLPPGSPIGLENGLGVLGLENGTGYLTLEN